MKIKRIKFQNYTVFEDQQMEFSPGINVIIGENGTGKTHLMKYYYNKNTRNEYREKLGWTECYTQFPMNTSKRKLMSR